MYGFVYWLWLEIYRIKIKYEGPVRKMCTWKFETLHGFALQLIFNGKHELIFLLKNLTNQLGIIDC